MNVTVIGIANSVELFQGEISSNLSPSKKRKVICELEQKLLFKPYTKE
jgi:hypothetical protein